MATTRKSSAAAAAAAACLLAAAVLASPSCAEAGAARLPPTSRIPRRRPLHLNYVGAAAAASRAGVDDPMFSLRGGASSFFRRRQATEEETPASKDDDGTDSAESDGEEEDDDAEEYELYDLATEADGDVDASAADSADGSTVAQAQTGATVELKASTPPRKRKRSSLFPILPREVPQFLSMSTMMFLFIYVFTTVRDTKDTLVVSHCGAESIPFLKLYAVMPCAALFIVMYSRASNVLDRKALFYVTLIPFFVFYAAFAFVLYPNRDVIHWLPRDGSVAGPGPLSLIRYWSYSLYFIVSELWASAGVPLLFWQCANDVTSLTQAKRFYPLLAVIGNLAPIVSGTVMSFLVALQRTNDDVGFQSTLQGLATIKVFICVGIIFLYNLVYDLADKRVRSEERERVNEMLTSAKVGDRIEVEVTFSGKQKKKAKPTMRESLAELSKSRELKSMATMVICYNACIELTEVLWKALLRKSYTNKSAYMDFMAKFSQTVGWVALFLQLVASSIIRNLGWKWAALMVPLSMGALAIYFFSAVAGIGEGSMTMATALLIGTLQNVVSKVTKYSLFDPCKEMAYIPLGPEAKVKGKAAVEVLGARMGRSIGSASQQLLVLATGGGSIIQCAPALAIIYLTAIGFWTNAVSTLGKLFEQPPEDTQATVSSLASLVQVRVDQNKGKIVSIEAERGRY